MNPVTNFVVAATAYVETATPGSRIARLITDFPIRPRCRKPGDYLFRSGDEFNRRPGRT